LLYHPLDRGDLPSTALRDAVFAYPTLAESLNTLISSFDA
jgi:hypothetical protein